MAALDVETVTNILGYKKRNNQKWITPGMWQKINERKQLKAEMLSTKSLRLQEQIQQAYKSKNKVKRSARKDKRSFIEEMANEAERATARGEMGIVYKITKQLCGNNTSLPAQVKRKDGTVLTTEREQTARWVHHFRDVLNHPQPVEPAHPQPVQDPLNIDISPPRANEIMEAIQSMKNRKAPGADCIHAEMLKATPTTITTALADLFRTIWESETIPSNWDKGLTVRLPKKGDLTLRSATTGMVSHSFPPIVRF